MTYRGEGRTCIAPDCEERAVAYGRCRRHYSASYRAERAVRARESSQRR